MRREYDGAEGSRVVILADTVRDARELARTCYEALRAFLIAQGWALPLAPLTFAEYRGNMADGPPRPRTKRGASRGA